MTFGIEEKKRKIKSIVSCSFLVFEGKKKGAHSCPNASKSTMDRMRRSRYQDGGKKALSSRRRGDRSEITEDDLRQSLHPSNIAKSAIEANRRFAERFGINDSPSGDHRTRRSNRMSSSTTRRRDHIVRENEDTYNSEVEFISDDDEYRQDALYFERNNSRMINDRFDNGQNQQHFGRGRNVSSSQWRGGYDKESSFASMNASNCGYDYDGCFGGGIPWLNDKWISTIPFLDYPPVKWLMSNFGFVASYAPLNITSIAQMPFKITPLGQYYLALSPNVGFTMEQVYEAVGLSSIFENMPSFMSMRAIARYLLNTPFVLGNLPQPISKYSSLYKLKSIPFLGGEYFLIQRVYWIDDCLAPRKGDYISIANGATAVVWEIDTVDSDTQQITFIPTTMESLDMYRIKHMCSPCKETARPYWMINDGNCDD